MSVAIISENLVEQAFLLTKPLIFKTMKRLGLTVNLSVVITGSPLIKQPDSALTFKENCFLVTGIGDKEIWKKKFEAFALSKAEISVRSGQDTARIAPHFLMSGDTIYWGAVVLDEIVVACSGDDAHFDEMYSMWIAATIKAMCKKEFNDRDKKLGFI